MKKEGDDDVVYLSPMLKVGLPKEEHPGELRKEIKEYLYKNYRDKKIKNTATGIDIVITKKGIEKLIRTGSNKLNILFHIESIIRDAVPVRIEEVTKFNNYIKKIAKFVYVFESMIFVNGQPYSFGLKTFFIEKDNVHLYWSNFDIDEPI